MKKIEQESGIFKYDTETKQVRADQRQGKIKFEIV